MKLVDRTLERMDEFQRRHRWAAFPFAVIKKFGDDGAGNLASLLALYGFLSMFLQNEDQRFPGYVAPSTDALAATVVLVAAIVSGLIVRRMLDRLDLIAALKSRE